MTTHTRAKPPGDVYRAIAAGALTLREFEVWADAYKWGYSVEQARSARDQQDATDAEQERYRRIARGAEPPIMTPVVERGKGVVGYRPGTTVPASTTYNA